MAAAKTLVVAAIGYWVIGFAASSHADNAGAVDGRAAATLAVGAVALPVEFLPGIDALYDIAAPIGLLWFWYTFFRDLYRGALPSGRRLLPSKPEKVQAR